MVPRVSSHPIRLFVLGGQRCCDVCGLRFAGVKTYLSKGSDPEARPCVSLMGGIDYRAIFAPSFGVPVANSLPCS